MTGQVESIRESDALLDEICHIRIRHNSDNQTEELVTSNQTLAMVSCMSMVLVEKCYKQTEKVGSERSDDYSKA